MSSYTHTQGIAAATWEITHGLGARPVVSARVWQDGVLQGILPNSIEFPDIRTVIIRFTSPRIGEARLI